MPAAVLLAALLLLAPFAALAVFAFEPQAASNSASWLAAFDAMARSLVLGTAVCTITAALGLSLAYVVSYRRFWGRRALQKLLILPLLFPPFVLANIYAELLSPSGPFADSFASWLPLPFALDFRSAGGFVFCMSLSLFPYAYLLCKMSLEEHGSAPFSFGQSIGLDRRKTLRRILLPLCLPALLLGATLVLMETLGDWATASTLSVRTASVVLHDLWFAREVPHFVARFSLLLILLLIGLLIALSRRLQPAHLRHALAGLLRSERTTAVLPRGGGWLDSLLCSLPVLLGFVIPLLATLQLFADSIERVDLSGLRNSCLHTLLLLLAVGLIALLFAAAITYGRNGRLGWLAGLLTRWAVVSYLMPVMVFAAAVLVLSARALPLSRYADPAAFAILSYAVALRFLCFLLVPIGVGLSSLSERLSDVAKSLAMSPARAFLAVHLPHLKRFAALGLLLVLLQTLREVALTVWLSPFGFEPLAAKVYALARIDMLAESSGWVLALLLLAVGPVMLLLSFVSKQESATSETRRARASTRGTIAQGR